jgi:hypothetical protein
MPVSFDISLIAPCGINCGTCYAYMRPRNRCNGCLVPAPNKPKTRQYCKIRNCDKHAGTGSVYCYDCTTFPCLRLQQIDKRYRIKYKTSLIRNLVTLKETGVSVYLENEVIRWTCPDCGSVLTVHLDKCLKCGYPRKDEIL